MQNVSIYINSQNSEFPPIHTLIEDCHFRNNSDPSQLSCIFIKTLGKIIQNRICSTDHLDPTIYHSNTNTNNINCIYALLLITLNRLISRIAIMNHIKCIYNLDLIQL